MFFKLVLKIADRSRWTRWACSLQREMTRLCGDNFDFWTDADRKKAIDRRSALLDAADRMTCLRRPDALVTALAEHRADDAVKLARGYLMELRQDVLLADSVLGLQREKEVFVERRSEYLRELHGLVRMEVGLEPEDALFGELSRKFHSRYLARVHYRKEALRREDQERERIRERERSRERTVELTR